MSISEYQIRSPAEQRAIYASLKRKFWPKAVQKQQFTLPKPLPEPVTPVTEPAPYHSLQSSVLTCRDYSEAPLTMEALLNAVSSVTGVSITNMRSATRKEEWVTARHLFFYLARTYTKHSLPAMGRFCGGKDHTTALHGVKKVKSRLGEHQLVLNAILEHAKCHTGGRG